MSNGITSEIDLFSQGLSEMTFRSDILKAQTDLDESYKRRINLLAQSADDSIFDHSGVIYSSIILTTLVNYTKSHLRIVCENFGGHIKNDHNYLKAIERFIKRGGQLQIILTNLRKEPPHFFRLIDSYNTQDNVDVKVFKNNHRIVEAPGKDIIHFTVGDSSKYRIEKDIYNYKGTASFNDPESAKLLIDVFKIAFDDSNITEDFTIDMAHGIEN